MSVARHVRGDRRTASRIAAVTTSAATVIATIATSLAMGLAGSVGLAPSAHADPGSAPVGHDDTAISRPNAITVIDVLGNDSHDAAVSFDPATLTFPAASQGAGVTTNFDGWTTVAGQGDFFAADDGTVSFWAFPGYIGAVTPIVYRITDTTGRTTTATLSVWVRSGVQSHDDAGRTPTGTPRMVDVLLNDATDDGLPLDPTSVVFADSGQPSGSTSPTGDQRTLSVPGQGTYAVDPATGAITFTPLAGFAGVATPVLYTATANSGTGAVTAPGLGRLTVTVDRPVAAVADRVVATAGGPVTVRPLSNDSSDPLAPLSAASLVFTTAGQPADATVTSDGLSLSVPGEGTYAVVAGTVVFTPLPTATLAGRSTTPVTYQVTDSDGGTGTATISIDVLTGPLATADTAFTPYGRSVTVNALGNDRADLRSALVPSSLVFAASGQPAGAVRTSTTITVPRQGSYVVTAGRITFTPAVGFSGAATPVRYQVADGAGNLATATVTVTVGRAPLARPDAALTAVDRSVQLAVLANDNTDPSTSLNTATLRFATTGQPAGSRLLYQNAELVVPNQGVYTIDVNTGLVSFFPAATFAGTTSTVTYTVADRQGHTVNGTIRIEVRRGIVAGSDNAITAVRRAVTVPVLRNDSSDRSTPVVSSSLRFAPTGQPPHSSVSADRRTVSVGYQGTYRIVSGGIAFTPYGAFSGPAYPVRYQITDSAGRVATGVMRVVVDRVSSRYDRGYTSFRRPIALHPMANDAARTKLLGWSVHLWRAGLPRGSWLSADGRHLIVPGQGRYDVYWRTGTVVFRPYSSLHGRWATPVRYTVRSTSGALGISNLAVHVGARR